MKYKPPKNFESEKYKKKSMKLNKIQNNKIMKILQYNIHFDDFKIIISIFLLINPSVHIIHK